MTSDTSRFPPLVCLVKVAKADREEVLWVDPVVSIRTT
jgi:hypothetical protein